MTTVAEYRTHHLRSTSGGVLAELVVVATVLAAGFAYVDVPIDNALLIGIAVTLQAAFGTVVLTRVLAGVKGSVLLLLGPGVIVGGTLSFALFQIAGRGWFGAVLVTAAGLLSSFRLVRSTPWQLQKTERLWLILQILGLAAFALTWEFGELLPVAIACFTFGIFASQSPRFPRLVKWLVGVAATGCAFASYLLRQKYWWLVTDDYLLFEVMSRHITKHGIFANWGVSDFSRYHWLAYGWNGLLSILGGNPEPLVTLTRVMPALYCISLGVSLILISRNYVGATRTHFLSTLPAWSIIALHRLDWSGTSTSGVYAAIAGLTATTTLDMSTTNSVKRRMAMYAIWLPIIALTKFPGLFAVVFSFVLLEAWNNVSHLQPSKRLLLLVPMPFVTALLVSAAISFTNAILGTGRFVNVNPSLEQLAEFGPRFAGIGLLLQRFWTWSLVVVGLLLVMQSSLQPAKHLARGLAYCTIWLLPFALFLDVRLNAVANNNEYFSGPMYFLSSLPLLLLVRDPTPMRVRTHTAIRFVAFSIALFAIGYLWVRLELATKFWRFIGTQAFEWNGLKVALLQWLSADGRFSIALVLGLTVLAGVWRTKWFYTTLLAAMFALTAFTLYGYLEHSKAELARERSIDERELKTGSIEIQDVGLWLRRNSQPSSQVATNHIVDSNGRRLSDYSLAVWSDRTFLVLGPKYGSNIESAKERAVQLSLRFAESPTRSLCRTLIEQGVGWFVVDRRLTKTRSWQVCATTAYQSENFEVLQLEP